MIELISMRPEKDADGNIVAVHIEERMDEYNFQSLWPKTYARWKETGLPQVVDE